MFKTAAFSENRYVGQSVENSCITRSSIYLTFLSIVTSIVVEYTIREVYINEDFGKEKIAQCIII
jgi:hypothetical protein